MTIPILFSHRGSSRLLRWKILLLSPSPRLPSASPAPPRPNEWEPFVIEQFVICIAENFASGRTITQSLHSTGRSVEARTLSGHVAGQRRVWANYKLLNYPITQWSYSICTRPSGSGTASGVPGRCGARHLSRYETWCTQETVQCGAQDFSVTYSRRMSSTVYSSSGRAG